METHKYEEISEKISNAIAKGRYKDKLPGLYRLAAEYETSHKTVSHALRLLEEKGLVTVNGTRGTYISGKKLRPRFRLIGLIGLDSSWNTLELDAMRKILSKDRYRLVPLSDCRDLDELLRNSPEFLENFPADAFLFAYSTLTEHIAATLRGAGIPFLALNHIMNIPGINWAAYKSEDGLRLALEKMAEHGHRRIAYFEYKNPNYNYSSLMQKTYKDFMTKLDAWDERLMYCPYSCAASYKLHGEDAHHCFTEESIKHLLSLKNRPTAIYSPLDPAYACQVLRENGIRVPEDISVVGIFDNTRVCEISGVLHDYTLRASRAAEGILKLLKYPETPLARELLVHEWNPGSTLGPPPSKPSNS